MLSAVRPLRNREDLTTFVRVPRAGWRAEDVQRLHAGLKATLANL